MSMRVFVCANWDFNVKTLLDHVHTIHESLKTNCFPNVREGHTDKCHRKKMFDNNDGVDDDDDAKKGFNLTNQSSCRKTMQM